MGLSITFCVRPVPAQQGTPNVVAECLRRLGHDVRQQGDEPPAAGPGEVVWIYGNSFWFPRVCRALLRAPAVERPLVVFWHIEPLPLPRAARRGWPRLSLREAAKIVLRDRRATDPYTNAFHLRRMVRRGLPDVLAVSTQSRREFLAEWGIHADWVPLGWDPGMGRDLGLERDLDVLFLGALDVARHRRPLAYLRRRGVDLVSKGDWFDPSLWGEGRSRLLSRARVLLNVQRHPGELSGVRLILGMAHGALVISEPIYAPDPFVPGTHFVSVPLTDMPEAIRHFLAHEEERARIARAGHELVTREITLERSIGRIVELAREQLDRARRVPAGTRASSVRRMAETGPPPGEA